MGFSFADNRTRARHRRACALPLHAGSWDPSRLLMCDGPRCSAPRTADLGKRSLFCLDALPDETATQR